MTGNEEVIKEVYGVVHSCNISRNMTRDQRKPEPFNEIDKNARDEREK